MPTGFLLLRIWLKLYIMRGFIGTLLIFFIHISSHVDGVAPSGTVKVPGLNNVFLDKNEVTNKNWLEYMNDLKKENPEEPEIYQRAMPDMGIWLSAYKGDFENPGIYAHYPVVGVNFPQVLFYCKWRSERVSKKRKKEIVYSLPSYEEFYKAARDKQNSPAADLYSTDFNHRRSFIGICDNAAEMTNIEGLAINGFWGKECLDSLRYLNNGERLGFRCKAKFIK
jgi:hypothetical protein